MKDTNNDKENRDIFGHKWTLAPGGRKNIDKCKSRVWAVHTELGGYASLFRNMGNCELDSGELYGISLTLQRMSKCLEKISDELSQTVVKEEP